MISSPLFLRYSRRTMRSGGEHFPPQHKQDQRPRYGVLGADHVQGEVEGRTAAVRRPRRNNQILNFNRARENLEARPVFQ